MKTFIVVALFVAAAAAAPATPDGDAQIVAFDVDTIGGDGYSYSVATSNDIQFAERGEIVDRGTENEGISVQGSYSYRGTDGKLYAVTYTAGNGGFQPVGDHIPA